MYEYEIEVEKPGRLYMVKYLKNFLFVGMYLSSSRTIFHIPSKHNTQIKKAAAIENEISNLNSNNKIHNLSIINLIRH